MIRLLFIFAALCALAFPAGAADRRFAVADFDRVVVEGPFAVRLTIGSPSSAVASGSPQALDAVSVEVQGTTLRVRRNNNAWTATPGRAPPPAIVTLTTRNLRSARVIGAGSLDLAGPRGLRIELAVEGSGRLAATGIAADTLSLALRGAGALTVAGTAGVLTADVQGSGSLDGAALTAQTATLAAATTGTVALDVRRTATITASGLGAITVAGSPACTVRGPAAGIVRCGAGN